MQESIYAPPEAEVAAPRGDGPRYYVVSPLKFLILSILTFGLYFVYWFYRNWKQIKFADNADIWPVPRGFFYIFFTHSLFGDVDDQFETQGKTYDWSPSLIAWVFVLISVLSGIPDRMVAFSNSLVWIFVIPMVTPVVLAMLLLQGQKAINAACDDVGGASNASLTAANWAWMIIGGLMWVLILLGAFATMVDPTLSQ